jgi:hypothetical protein
MERIALVLRKRFKEHLEKVVTEGSSIVGGIDIVFAIREPNPIRLSKQKSA